MTIKKIPDLSGVATATVNAAKQAAGSTSSDTLYRVGSTGREVAKLQEALAAAGYDVGNAGADGVYGKDTAAAVKQYQKDHGLAVDGIAGKNTLGSLYNANNTASTNALNQAAQATVNGAKTAATNPAGAGLNALSTVAEGVVSGAETAAGGTSTDNAPTTDTKGEAKTTTDTTTDKSSDPVINGFTYGDFTYEDYTPSDIVNQANALLQQQYNAKPGAYQSQWQDEIDDYLNRIENRDPFSYDFNSDALYNQYKENYILQGQMAMMDTMGQAAAMTGGYGNSYAQTVGQQAYNQQLNQLNNIMPELYQMAYNRYSDEGQRLMDMYNMYMGQENQDYSRYQDSMNAWQSELDYLTGRYESERDLDYDKYLTGRQEAHNDYLSDKDIAWNEYLAELEKQEAAANLMASIGNYDRLGEVLGLTPAELAAYKSYMSPEVDSYDGGGGGYSYNYDTHGMTTEEIKALQAELGVTADGVWGPNTQAAYEAAQGGNSRDAEIETWVASSLANANSASFNMDRLISGSSYLKDDEERAYAKEVADTIAGINQDKYKK